MHSSSKTIIAVAAIAALALSGCSPQEQKPYTGPKIVTAKKLNLSDIPTSAMTGVPGATLLAPSPAADADETAVVPSTEPEPTTSAAPTFAIRMKLPKLRRCGRTEPLPEVHMSLSCNPEEVNYLTNIQWKEVTSTHAWGVGTLVGTMSSGLRDSSTVKISVSDPTTINNQPVFTSVAVNGTKLDDDAA